MIRIVLIDDEPQSCKSLAIKLKAIAEDIEIIGIYHDPEKAICGIRKMEPAVVFLDIEMPGMNGFQLLEKMEKFDFEVIFVTAYDEYMLNALRISALDYLLKPVDTEELKNALTRLRNKIEMHENLNNTKEQLEFLGATPQAQGSVLCLPFLLLHANQKPSKTKTSMKPFLLILQSAALLYRQCQGSYYSQYYRQYVTCNQASSIIFAGQLGFMIINKHSAI